MANYHRALGEEEFSGYKAKTNPKQKKNQNLKCIATGTQIRITFQIVSKI